MTDDERREVIVLRIENAYTSLKEAELLLDNGYYNASVNRMYYAAYYVVSALLLSREIQANTHAGVRQMLGLYFTKPGIISTYDNAFFSDLFAKRHSGDYDVYIYFDEQITRDLLPQTVKFVQTMEALIT